DPYEHIHIAWLCILESSDRVQEADKKLVRMLDERGIPVVAVITKAVFASDFRHKVQELLPEARNVVRVRALETIIDDGIKLKPMGLQELVDLTMELVPDGVKGAVSAAQRVSVKVKLDRAHAAVATSAGLAITAGASPIPFSDAGAIIPIQIGM